MTEEFQKSVGERIKAAAEKVGGLDQLAQRTGIKRRTIYDYAAGKTEPKISTIVQIAASTGADIGWLATGEAEAQDADLGGGDTVEVVREVGPLRYISHETVHPPDLVRKYIWNIADTFWKKVPRKTKSEDFADQFVEMFDYLISREDVNDEAATEVINFSAERLKRTSGSGGK